MATEAVIHVRVVLPDHVTTQTVCSTITGRELPGLPGTWVASATTGTTGADDPWWDVHDAEADADGGVCTFD